ncbi:TPA: hypothetical protein RZK20_001701 [Campylobacter coli]|nr:hypothetical protein [Campylobacter coli]
MSLIKFDDNIGKLSTKEMDMFVIQKTNEIANRLNNLQRVVTKAKERNRQAETLDTSSDLKNMFSFGMLGKSKTDKIKDRQDLIIEAQAASNEAMVEINDIVQATIVFNCYSLEFAKKMVQAMGVVVSDGIKGANGNIEYLSKETQESLEIIMDGTSNFIKKQEKIEQQANENKQYIQELSFKVRQKDELDKEQSEHIKNLEIAMLKKDDLDDRQDRDILENTEKINLNAKAIYDLKLKTNQKDLLDSEQDKKIDEISSVIMKSTKELEDKIKNQNIKIYLLFVINLMISVILYFVLGGFVK